MRPEPSEIAVSNAWRRIDAEYLSSAVSKLRTCSIRPYVCMLCDTEYSKLPKASKCAQCGRAAVASKRHVVSDCIRSLFSAYKTAYHSQPSLFVESFNKKCQEAGVDPHDYITIPQ